MLPLDAHTRATEGMAAPELLRYLLADRFRGQCMVTAALRARSIVVLHMMAEIDRSIPVVFCHAPGIYPESLEYGARIIDTLRLADVRDHDRDETGVLPGDEDHCEEIRSKVWGGGTVSTTVHLNRSLAGADCWISAVYHRPYSAPPGPRLTMEGRLLRADPLNGWTRERVHAYMAERGLPHHPRVRLTQPKPAAEDAAPYPTYHY